MLRASHFSSANQAWRLCYARSFLMQNLFCVMPCRFREGMALSEEEVSAFEDYFYHITAARGSGEHALKYILKPFAWAHNPLEGQLQHLKVLLLQLQHLKVLPAVPTSCLKYRDVRECQFLCEIPNTITSGLVWGFYYCGCQSETWHCQDCALTDCSAARLKGQLYQPDWSPLGPLLDKAILALSAC